MLEMETSPAINKTRGKFMQQLPAALRKSLNIYIWTLKEWFGNVLTVGTFFPKKTQPL
jgi:hypothetical protein